MAEPQPSTPSAPTKNPTAEEVAAKMAADNKMSRFDPLADLMEQVAKDYQTLGTIFDEKARRIAEKNKGLPPEQQELPDATELKALVDAGARVVEINLQYRKEQREAFMFAMMRKPQAGAKDTGMKFDSDEKKTAKKPTKADPGYGY